MAYAVKYLFKFQSTCGTVREIRVLQNGYSGAVIQRPLGRAPVIKKEQNGGVHGTSLTFYAECHVDREYIEFYTSDPKEYRVDVYAGSTLLWQGYITPELYSEPDIAPPYDVQVVATDGVGELKLYDYAAQGTVSLRAQLTYLLGHTGLGTDVFLISSLKPGSAGAGSLLEKTINLDYVAGKTCYEVLTYILDTLHATITWWKGAWILTRETNVTFSSGKVRYFNTAGNSALLADSVQTLGKMRSNPVWPVGQLSTVIDPAKNKVVVQAPWHTVTCLQNAGMTSDASWTKSNGATFSTDGYLLPQNLNSSDGAISQSVSMQGVRVPMSLSVKATGMTSLITFQLSMAIAVLVTYTVGGATYYLRKGDDGVPVWRSDSGNTFDFLQTLVTCNATEIEAEEMTIDNIPPFVQGSNFPSGTLTVTIVGSAAKVFSAHLDVVLPKGYQDILHIDNGARGEGSEVEIAIGRETADNAYYAAFLQGLLLDSGSLITSFSDANFTTGRDYLAFIARDYALSVALPRARATGKVFLESTVQIPPLVFTKGVLNYWLETFSWDLYEDELEIDARTLPSASLTVQSEVIAESDGSTVSSRSSAGSSGPSSSMGGGGGVNYWEIDGTLATLLAPKSAYDYVHGKSGLFFTGGDTSTPLPDLYVDEVSDGQGGTVRVLRTPLALITGGDQIIQSGTPGGGGGGGGATKLSQLDDVSLTSLSNGQMLAWDSSLNGGQGAWKNVPAPTGTITSVTKGTAVSGGAVTTSNGAVTIQFPTVPTKVSDLTNDTGFITGNQTITLGGDVSGSGTTSITVSIGAGKVTNAMLANSSITINGSATSLGGSFSTASITSGTAGTSSATSGYTLSVPYVTMNQYGIVTGYGTHTHTVNNIPNTSLANSSITIGATTVSLGGTSTALTMGNNQAIQVTNNPSSGSATVYNALYMSTSNNLILGGGSYTTYLSGTELRFRYGSGSTLAMRIGTNGNISMGTATSNASYKLDVSGDIRASEKIYIGTSGAYFEYHPETQDSAAYVSLNVAFLTGGDQIVQSGTPGGGGGGGGAGFLYELGDVLTDTNHTKVKESDGTTNADSGDIFAFNGSKWYALKLGTGLSINTSGSQNVLNGTTYSAGAGTTAVTNTTNRVWSAANLNSFISTQGYTKTAPYTLPLAASGTRGGVQIGYSSSGKNYAVQLSSEKMYVNVPWTDTTYTAGTGLTLSTSNVFSVNKQVYPVGCHSFTTGYLVKTEIADTETGKMILVTIEGNSYNASVGSILTQIQFYKNSTATDNTAFTRPSVTHHGTAIGDVKAFCYDGFLYIWFSQPTTYNTYFVTVRRGTEAKNCVTSVTNAAVPTTGVTCLTNITTVYSHVPSTRTVNGKALSSNVTLTLDDIDNGSTRSLANYLPLAGGTMTGNIVTGNSIGLEHSTYGIYACHSGSNTLIGTANRGSVYLKTANVNVTHRKYTDASTFTDLTVLDSGNYTSYTPILNSASTHATSSSVIYAPTGAGTSGYWLKSSGSGAPTWAAWPTTLSGYGITDFVVKQDGTNNPDTFTTPGIYRVGTQTGTDSFPYGNILVIRGTTSADTIAQVAFTYSNSNIYFRRGTTSNFTSDTWKTIWNSGNSNLTTVDWSAKALTLAGAITGATTGAFSGNVTVSQSSNSVGFRVTGTTYDLSFMIGSQNVNRGIYSWDASKWLLYFDATNTIANNGAFRPGTTNAHDLGTSTYRWKGVYSSTLDTSGNASIGGDLTLTTNPSALAMTDSGGTARNVVSLTSTNNLHLGGETSTAGINTYINGKAIYLRYGTSNTIGMIMNASGNVSIYSSDVASTSYKFYVRGNEAVYGHIYMLRNNYRIYMRNAEVPGATADDPPILPAQNNIVMTINDSNQLLIGSGTYNLASAIPTYIYGTTLYLRTWNGSQRTALFANAAGNVGLGTTSLTSGARLTVSGAIVSTGDQSISSDATLKTNLRPVKYTIEDIAKTRAVTFDWKDGKGHSAGSIAQDWKSIIPELVHGEEGNMTLAYGQIALINSILLAKHETEQDKEIKRLKARVKELESRLNIS